MVTAVLSILGAIGLSDCKGNFHRKKHNKTAIVEIAQSEPQSTPAVPQKEQERTESGEERLGENEIIFESKEWYEFVASKGKLPTISNDQRHFEGKRLVSFLTKRFGKTSLVIYGRNDECPPCRVLKPFLADYRDRTGANIGILDNSIFFSYGTPFFLFFKNGKLEQKGLFVREFKPRVIGKYDKTKVVFNVKEGQSTIDKQLDGFFGR